MQRFNAASYKTAAPPLQSLLRLHDKWKLYQDSQEFPAGYPATILVGKVPRCCRFAKLCIKDVIIKPRFGERGRNKIKVRDVGDLKFKYQQIEKSLSNQQLIAQHMV